MDWIITNLPEFIKKRGGKKYFTDLDPYLYKTGDISFYIEGYIIPRLNITVPEFKTYSQNELLNVLIKKYELNFINNIKGSFIIILFLKENFYIFNDPQSLKKYFIYQKGDQFIISKSLKVISDNVKLTLSRQNAILFCLMEHFTDGMTLFNEVIYSKPASILEFSDKIRQSTYWTANDLLKLNIQDYSFSHLAEEWRSIIKGYLEYLNPKNITMTLTGGNDSRMVLAGLLANGILPNAFTFGHPGSSDVAVAKEISKRLGLNFKNHFVEEPSAEWFSGFSKKIIRNGNSLINIHRAHRLDAIEKEIVSNSDNEMIFGGFMGGDYVKGIIYDDYITSKLMKLWKYSDKSNVEKVRELSVQCGIILNAAELKEIANRIETLPFFNKKDYPDLIREFFYIFHVIGCTHDWQDSAVFDSMVKYVVNPFMDIDFLELLFSSGFSMLNKNNPEDNFFKKLKYPELHVKISHSLAPEISDILYAKKGSYSNKDFLGNKFAYTMKRIIRFLKKGQFSQNFACGEWMIIYVKEELNNIHPVLKDIFDLERIREQFESRDYDKNEKSWHIYTNPVNLSLNYYFFIDN